MRAAKSRTLDGRWRSWAPSWLASHRPSRLALPQQVETKGPLGPAVAGCRPKIFGSGSLPQPWCFAVTIRRIWGERPSF